MTFRRSVVIQKGPALPIPQGITVGRGGTFQWNQATLPREIEEDMREAARRRGAPLPDEPTPAVAHATRSDVLRLPSARRRVVRRAPNPERTDP